MKEEARIEAFLAGQTYAVAGASTNREKYGNKVLRCLLEHGKTVFAIHPRDSEVEGVPCVPDVASLPAPVHGLSIVTPPPVTEKLVEQAAAAGIRHVWMQPGTESEEAVRRAEELGLAVVAGGPCVLRRLGCV